MSYTPFPIADFKNGLFSANEVWIAPADAFSQLENVRLDRGLLKKRPGLNTMGYFPKRIDARVGGVTGADPAVVLASDINITGITQANPAVVTAPSHGFSDGDTVLILSVGGMTEVNGNTYTVANKTANTFELSGTNSTGYTAYTYGGTVGYQHGLSDNDVVIFQSVNGMNGTDELQNRKFIVSNASAANNTFELKNIDSSSFSGQFDVTGITQANPAVVTTSAAHGFSNGDVVYITGVTGMTEVNGLLFTVANKTATTFELSTVNSSGFTGYSAGGKVVQAGGTIDKIQSLTYKASIDSSGITKPDEDTAGKDSEVVVTTAAAHGLSTGNKVLISGDFGNAIVGMTQIDNTATTIQVKTPTTFSLDNVNTKDYTAHTSGGDVFLINSTSGNAIMGIGELFQDESDNILVVCSEDRVAKYNSSLDNFVSISTGDDWTGSNTQLFQLQNAYDKLWMTNFKDGVKTTDGTSVTTEVFDITGSGGASPTSGDNNLTRARFVMPFNNRLCLFNTVEGANRYPQRVRWSRIGYGAGTSSEWDDTVGDDTTAGSLDAATDEEIINVGYYGDNVIVFFERSIWSLSKTGQFENPFRWQKVAEAPDLFNSPFSMSFHDRLIWALSLHGLVATDGIQVLEVDAAIPYWYRALDDGDFPIVYGGKIFRYDENWTCYSDSGNENSNRNDSVKVFNYKNKAFYDYTIGVNCMGEYTISDKPSVTWGDLENGKKTPKWGDVENLYPSWGSFYSGKGSSDTVFGDDTGRIYRLADNADDDGAIIPIKVETVRMNPFKDRGQVAHLGFVDILFKKSDQTNVDVKFFVDFDDTPLMTETVNLAPDSSFADNPLPGIDKVWKRIYVNLIGNTHQLRLECNQQSSDFEVHAIVPYFKSAGRINLV